MQLTARVDREEALAFLGHAGQELGPDLAERLERAVRLCEEELTPRGVWCVLPAAQAPALLPGRDIAHHIEDCLEVALMAVTLGTESELLLRRERALSPTDGLLADACASSLVEQAANALSVVIAEEAAAHGLAVTSRFSPGYGDLPLSCQPAFLAVCGADRALGIRATETNLLVPMKSITAVIGFAPAAVGTAGKGTVPLAVSNHHEGCGCELGTAADAAAAPTFDPRCSTCYLAPTCALRAQGRTCHGHSA